MVGQGSSSMQVSHRLCVRCPGLGQGESIAVTGSGAELGNWRKKAVQVLVQDSQDRFGRFYRTKNVLMPNLFPFLDLKKFGLMT